MEDSILSEIKKHFDHLQEKEKRPRKILKTIPVRKEWTKPLKEMIKSDEEARKVADEALKTAWKAFHQMRANHNIFWATVERDTEIYDKMCYNAETNEIEVYEDQ